MRPKVWRDESDGTWYATSGAVVLVRGRWELCLRVATVYAGVTLALT